MLCLESSGSYSFQHSYWDYFGLSLPDLVQLFMQSLIFFSFLLLLLSNVAAHSAPCKAPLCLVGWPAVARLSHWTLSPLFWNAFKDVPLGILIHMRHRYSRILFQPLVHAFLSTQSQLAAYILLLCAVLPWGHLWTVFSLGPVRWERDYSLYAVV